MTAEQVQAWLEAYARAWRERDADQAAALFTQDSVYRSSPFREPHRSLDGVRAYWTRATGDQRDLDLWFGQPIIQGERVAVEWWAVMRVVSPDGGLNVGTLPGCLYLIFAEDGRCNELREYWHWKDDAIPAYEGWGT